MDNYFELFFVLAIRSVYFYKMAYLNISKYTLVSTENY